MIVHKIMVDFKIMVLINMKDPQWHPSKIITIKGQSSEPVAHIELSFLSNYLLTTLWSMIWWINAPKKFKVPNLKNCPRGHFFRLGTLNFSGVLIHQTMLHKVESKKLEKW